MITLQDQADTLELKHSLKINETVCNKSQWLLQGNKGDQYTLINIIYFAISFLFSYHRKQLIYTVNSKQEESQANLRYYISSVAKRKNKIGLRNLELPMLQHFLEMILMLY